MYFHALSAYMLKRMSDDVPARVALRVRAQMRSQGVSQTRLAAELGCTQQALSRRLTGLVTFDVRELATVANALHTTVEALVKEG